MKISFRWIRELFPTHVTPEQAASVLTATGLEVEGLERVEDLPGGLRGLQVGTIVKCLQHPNADRLQLCKVDVGESELLQIVCGASNARLGIHVIVARTGATLHPRDGDPFTIKKGKIRGELSEGMICAEDEIGLGSSHDGIIELESQWRPGTEAREVYNLNEDAVLEIGLTPNRTDGMSHWGVARDLRAGLLHETVEGIAEAAQPMSNPNQMDLGKVPTTEEFQLSIEHPTGCDQYLALVLDGVEVGPSPEPIQRRLRAIGVNPQNNVVDAANFVLHELGQPLHAFDADCIRGKHIKVRAAKAGESIKTLDGESRALHPEDMVIADEESPMCLAGVFGGEGSGITDRTKRVFLESALFDPVVIRKMARRHGLSTDASFRFERGVDPHMIRVGLERVAALLSEWSGARAVSLHASERKETPKHQEIHLEWSALNRMVGNDMDPSRILSIMQALDIGVISNDQKGIQVAVPPYRRDVTRPADLVEEILRIHGFDKVVFPGQMTISAGTSGDGQLEQLRGQAAQVLVARGFQEIMSNSLTKSHYVEKAAERGHDSALHPSQNVLLLNPLSSDLSVMRQTLLFQGLEAIARNRNVQRPNLRLFEIGRAYSKKPDPTSLLNGVEAFNETEHLSLFMTGKKQPENWNSEGEDLDFYALKVEAQALLVGLGLSIDTLKEHPDEGSLLVEGLEWRYGDTVLGRMGIVHPDVAAACDVQQVVYWADFLIDPLKEVMNSRFLIAKELPKFPSVRRDLSLILDRGTTFGHMRDVAFKAEPYLLKRIGLFDVYKGDTLEMNEISYAISLTLRDDKKTLTEKKIDQAVQRVLAALNKETGARLR